MRLPLPRNRLVQLTLVGALLTTVVAAGLLVPGAFGDQSTPTDSRSDGPTLGPDAPTPNDQFAPATSGGGDDHDEYEEYDEYEDDDDDEHEDDDDDEHEDDEEYENRDAVNVPRANGGAYP